MLKNGLQKSGGSRQALKLIDSLNLYFVVFSPLIMLFVPAPFVWRACMSSQLTLDASLAAEWGQSRPKRCSLWLPCPERDRTRVGKSMPNLHQKREKGGKGEKQLITSTISPLMSPKAFFRDFSSTEFPTLASSTNICNSLLNDIINDFKLP